jgi:hypothetical protein
MNESKIIIKNWIKLGIVSGLLVSVIYPSLIFIPMPKLFQVILIMAWGPLMGMELLKPCTIRDRCSLGCLFIPGKYSLCY